MSFALHFVNMQGFCIFAGYLLLQIAAYQKYLLSGRMANFRLYSVPLDLYRQLSVEICIFN